MAEGHKRHWQKTRETFKLSNQKTVRDIPRERAKNSPSRPHSDLSNHNILLKKGNDRRQRVKSRTSPNEFSSSICRHTYHQRLHKTSKQKMELFFDANKIFVPSNATKAPDISCFIYNFSGAEGVKKTRKQYIAYWDVPKNCLSFKRDKDAAQ